mmetsp:Transcript_15723/g.45410  ORF Transcript_15723/g.45410 Transcript_15723/m.45410 type:complete len:244 (+) Transcript_15723:277-1008(+)
MFIRVSAASKTKSRNKAPNIGLSSPSFDNGAPMLSINVPNTNSVYIESGTFAKNSFPTSVPTVNCVNAIAKMYINPHNKARVKNTDLVAATMPLIRIMSSGMARNNRAILAMRDSLASRAIRRIEAFPSPPEPDPTEPSITMVSTHVSITIMKTSMLSNTNQPSLSPSRFLTKDMKRVNHSKEKKMQNACSAIWKSGDACNSVSALLWSVSIPIHIALTPITNKVIFSKRGCFASQLQTPVFL